MRQVKHWCLFQLGVSVGQTALFLPHQSFGVFSHYPKRCNFLGNCLAHKVTRLQLACKSPYSLKRTVLLDGDTVYVDLFPTQMIQSVNVQAMDWLIQDTITLLQTATGDLKSCSPGVHMRRNTFTLPLDASPVYLPQDSMEDENGLSSEVDAMDDGPLFTEEGIEESTGHHLLTLLALSNGLDSSVSVTNHILPPDISDCGKQGKLKSKEAAKSY
ncbi:hypothetical protein BS47DRAFT_1365081 [Hydnum rufescens UP504]|uniref:Uncharacterized protein n=1 Tax=Hydnum rufescens UP504 TaxID=1448309 RepID=A0A9P6APQ5_9AGAM|nr:hypothetical protein BS47DRAFT_1365081 [Hydnum rufescens UP504]